MGPNAVVALNLILGLIDRAAAIKALLDAAKAEGRDVTLAELDALVAADDLARAELVAAIQAARGA